MIDFDTQLVSTLETVLPTYYELVLTKDIKTPCISYQENNNYEDASGDTLLHMHLRPDIQGGCKLAVLHRRAFCMQVPVKLL